MLFLSNFLEFAVSNLMDFLIEFFFTSTTRRYSPTRSDGTLVSLACAVGQCICHVNRLERLVKTGSCPVITLAPGLRTIAKLAGVK